MFRFESKSVFSKFPEQIKIAYLAGASAMALLLRDFNSQLLLFAPVAVLLLASGYKETHKLLLALLPFLVLTDISFWIFLPNTQLSLGQIIAVSNMRFINLFFAIAFFIHTTNLFKVMGLLKKAGLPETVYLPAYVVLRFLPEIEKDLQEIITIQKIRGISPRRPLRYFRAIFVPLLLTVFERSDQISIAYYLRKKRGLEN